MKLTDFTDTPAALTELIESGQLIGALTFYTLKPGEDGKQHVGMMTGGITVEDAFGLLCTLRTSMMETLGFVDPRDMMLLPVAPEPPRSPAPIIKNTLVVNENHRDAIKPLSLPLDAKVEPTLEILRQMGMRAGQWSIPKEHRCLDRATEMVVMGWLVRGCTFRAFGTTFYEFRAADKLDLRACKDL